MTSHWYATILLGMLSPLSFAETQIEFQPIKQLKRTGSLGTCEYKPTDKESPFYQKLEPSERVTGSFMKSYSIHKQQGKYVSWFGVVRGIADTKQHGGTTLLLEHKFFDGLTDCHVMLVSQSGGGDFHASLGPLAESVPLLALVRVYGRINEEKNDLPYLDVEYIRVWPGLTFTFTDMGPDNKGNPEWAKFCVLCRTGNVYKPYPDKNYYLQVLGDPKDFGTVPVN